MYDIKKHFALQYQIFAKYLKRHKQCGKRYITHTIVWKMRKTVYWKKTAD